MQKQRTTLISTVNSFLSILLLVQIWLSVEAEHASHGEAVPLLLAVVSALCAAGVVALARSLPR